MDGFCEVLISRRGELTAVKTFDMMRDAMLESTLENIAATSRSLGTSKTHLVECLRLSALEFRVWCFRS